MSEKLNALTKIIKKSLPDILEAVAPIQLPDNMEEHFARAILVCAKVHEVTAPVAREPQNLQTMGDKARKFYSVGEEVCSLGDLAIPKFGAKKAAVRFDRDARIVKVWDTSIVKHGPRVRKDVELCPMTRAFLIAARAALSKAISVTPIDFRAMFPKSIKNRRDGAKFTVLTLDGKIRVEGLPEKVKPVEYSMLTDEWWPIFQAMDKDARTWSYAVADFHLPSLPYRALFVLTDGSRVAIGGAT